MSSDRKKPRAADRSHSWERLKRLEFGFIAYPRTEPACNAADVLALGRSSERYSEANGGSKAEAGYFEQAYLSACGGLNLPNAPEVLERLKYPLHHEFLDGRPSPFNTAGAAQAFQTLKEVKESCFSFRLLPPPYLEGDPYESTRNSPLARRDPAAGEAMRAVRVWKTQADATVLKALAGIDLAMCRLIGWNLEAEISFERLHNEFDYPAPLPREPHPDDYD